MFKSDCNAWHFVYALRLLFKVVCGSFDIALLTR
ncbi:DUF3265 domain-containing protein [Vibrio alginolyticus]|nr:DUF3265 domain-containing protein [Vibrio alginolyticus]